MQDSSHAHQLAAIVRARANDALQATRDAFEVTGEAMLRVDVASSAPGSSFVDVRRLERAATEARRHAVNAARVSDAEVAAAAEAERQARAADECVWVAAASLGFAMFDTYRPIG